MEITTTKDNVMSGIFFQDEAMKCMYDRFPEILFVDATYKLNDLRMPLYVFLVEDGNGESEIIAVWMIVTEDCASISQMAEIFKKYNPNWEKTKTIMSDKDFIERDALKSQFPEATILICLFHVLRTFRREITCDKLGITSAERILALEILQKMAYAKTLDEYSDLFEDLKAAHLGGVTEYFSTNWHPIKEQWVDGLKNEVAFMNRTNNRIECINQKLKSVITKYSSLPQFFSQLTVAIESLRTERDHRALTVFQKVPVTPYKPGTPEYQYMQLVTPYALNYVVKQLGLVNRVKLHPNKDANVYKIGSSEGELSTTVCECSCTFRKSMLLPCRHIFAVRAASNVDLYCPELCACRWTLAYYHSNHRVLAEPGLSANDSMITVTPEQVVSTKRILSQNEKYQKAFRVTQKLTSILAEAPMRQFDGKLASLQKLVQVWENGSNAIIQEVSTDAGR